jgi:glycosyltransferase involved in cell wall biosynthesis
MGGNVRIAMLAPYPSQYQAPLLRRIAAEPDIQLKVFFASDISTRRFVDPGFRREIIWDTDLLGGYEYEFLPAIGSTDRISMLRPLSVGLARRLRAGGFAGLWVHGYMRAYHWVAFAIARRLKMKVLLRDDANAISRERGKAKLAVKKIFFRRLTSAVDAFLSVGTLNRNYYLSYGVDCSRIFSVPWAVDNSFFQAAARGAAPHRDELRLALGLQPGRPVILFAGKLMPRKRPGDLLEAWARLAAQPDKRPYLLYVGDGELRGQLEGRAMELTSEAVRFLGFKNQSELPAYYDLCDVFVMPTVFEPWGLVINEVMNAGRAIIASDQVGCAPDLVRDGYNGFVYRAGSVADLHRVLRTALADPVRLTEMGRRSLDIINCWSFEEDVRGLRAALHLD